MAHTELWGSPEAAYIKQKMGANNNLGWGILQQGTLQVVKKHLGNKLVRINWLSKTKIKPEKLWPSLLHYTLTYQSAV